MYTKKKPEWYTMTYFCRRHLDPCHHRQKILQGEGMDSLRFRGGLTYLNLSFDTLIFVKLCKQLLVFDFNLDSPNTLF